MTTQYLKKKLQNHIATCKLKSTPERFEVLDAVECLTSEKENCQVEACAGQWSCGGMKHFDTDEVLEKVKRMGFPLSRATVYRALQLFCKAGIIEEVMRRNGKAVYEVAREQHHDHIICIKCGTIVEFEDQQLEKLQEEICQRLGFELADHIMYLKGICRSCRS